MYFRVVDGFVIVVATDWTRALASGDNAALARQAEMMTEIGKAKGIIVDRRIGGESTSEQIPLYLEYYLEGVVPSLVQGPVTLGTARYRRHDGYPSQQGISTDFTFHRL